MTPPLPFIPPKGHLNLVTSTWLPRGTSNLVGSIQDDDSIDLVSPSFRPATDELLTPPISPCLPLHSSLCMPLRTHIKWTSRPPTPPSEPTLRFVRSVLAETPRESSEDADDLDSDSFFHLGDGAPGGFDCVVGSPPRPKKTASVPVTPERATLAGPAPWSWPRRGERLGGSALLLETPTKTKFDVGASLADEFVRKEWAREDEDKLATRYVRVDGVPRRSTETDLKELFTDRYPRIAGCFSRHLGTNGTIILVFHDIRDAEASLQGIRSTTLLSTLTPFRALCITRRDFYSLHADDYCPLISPSEGVLVLTVEGPAISFSPMDLLAQYDLRNFRTFDTKTFVAEFWDNREAEEAAATFDELRSRGRRIVCSFEPGVATVLNDLKKPSHSTLRAQATPFYSSTCFPSVQTPAPAPAMVYAAPPSATKPRALFGSVINTSRPVATSSPAVVTVSSGPPHPNASQNTRGPIASPTPAPRAFRAPLPTMVGKFNATPTGGDPDWGIYRDDKIPARNVLDLKRIEMGLDVRTTMMIKNVPTRMTDVALMTFIDAAVGRSYDFLYLRMDFASEYNVGYGFVNFITPADLLAFAKSRLGTRWNCYHSDKLCVASYANIQGKENLVNKFRNSAVMLEVEEFRPKIFYTSGPDAGKPEPFPEGDDPNRIARSAANVHAVGLFPSSKPIFKIGHALRSLHM